MTKIYTPEFGHLENLDNLSGDEFMAGSEELFSPSFFIEYAQETNFSQLMMQLEFEKNYSKGKYGLYTTLCTIYGPMYVSSAMMRKERTTEQRLEESILRTEEKDYEPSVGGFTSVGVDVDRRYINKMPENKNDPFMTAVVSDMNLLMKLTQKNIPVVTSLRGNKEFSLDTKDGVMDKLDYWKYNGPRYGHCRARRLLRVPDNYLREYRYKSWDDLKLCLDNGFESKNVFMYFKESMLSDLGKIYFRFMRMKLWNGENPNKNIIRQDIASIASRLLGKPVRWDKKRPMEDASIYEVSLLLNQANPKIQVYLGNDRNKTITRGQTMEYIAKFI